MYTTHYATKPQHSAIEKNVLALHSFQRRVDREKAEKQERPMTNAEIARKRVTAAMYTATNSMSIHGPLAAVYILRKSNVFCSHEFRNLPLLSISREVLGEDYVHMSVVPVKAPTSDDDSSSQSSHTDSDSGK